MSFSNLALAFGTGLPLRALGGGAATYQREMQDGLARYV